MFVSQKERDETVRACRFCPMCYHADTVTQVLRKETHTPRGRALTMFAIDTGLLEWSEEAVESMYKYSADGLDQEWCVGNYDHDEMVLTARAEIVRAGKVPTHIRGILADLKKTGNPWGVAEAPRPAAAGDGRTLAFLGCTARTHRPGLGDALLRIGRAANASPGLLANDGSCGMTAYLLGDVELAEAQVKQLGAAVVASGVQSLVVVDADCYRFLQLRSRRFGVAWPEGFEILHVSEWLARLVDDGRLKLRASAEFVGKQVVYHDPCSLARFTRVIDPPRRVLAAIDGLRVQEFKWAREKARCCGGGGALSLTYPDLSAAIAARRVQEAHEAGAELIVSSCANCEQTLGAPSGDVSPIPVIDLLEVVGASLV